MARISGKNGIVKHGTNVLDGVTNWSISESYGTTPTTAMGDGMATHVTTHGSWTASVALNFDEHADAKQTLRAGDSVTLQLYTDGDATGKKFYEGVATCTSVGVETPFDGTVTRSYEFEGNGDLTIETVSA